MRIARRSVLAAVAAGAALAALAGCGTAAAPEERVTIRIGVSPDQLSGQYDPSIQNRFALDTKSVYDSLFILNDEFGFDPNVATGFELSDDGRTATVTLRDDVVFTDGTTLTAPELARYLEALTALDTFWRKPLWDDYGAVHTAVDDTTLEITTTKPMDLRPAGLLSELFLYVPLASPAAIDDWGPLATEANGSGPYVVESVTPEVSATLVRNEDFWDPEAYPFDEITITVFADEVAALNALKAGQIDAAKLSPSLAVEAEREGFALNEGAGRLIQVYAVDRAGEVQPALADVRVRQAMAYAFDRETINETINHGFGSITSQPFAVGLPEYVEGGDERYSYDPDKARALMAEAGYADGFDLTIPSTTFLGINTWQPIVTQYLGDIGIRVTFDEFADTGDFFTAVLSGDYPVIMYAEVAPQVLPLFISGDALFNVRGGADATVDELWPIVLTDTGEDGIAAGRELGEYVLDEAWLVPLAAPETIWATVPEFTVHVGNHGNPQFVTDFGLAG